MKWYDGLLVAVWLWTAVAVTWLVTRPGAAVQHVAVAAKGVQVADSLKVPLVAGDYSGIAGEYLYAVSIVRRQESKR